VKRSRIVVATLLTGACATTPALGASNRIVLERAIGPVAIGDERATKSETPQTRGPVEIANAAASVRMRPRFAASNRQ
jgi:hypothetical protein